MPFMRKYNTLLVTGTTSIRIPIIKRAVVDFAVGADWTPVAGDVKVFVDAAAAANITNLPTAIASGNTAFWEFILTAAELTCKQILVVIADAATKAVEDQSFIVETYGNASAMYAADLSLANLPANVTQLLGTAWLAPAVAGTPDVNAKQFGGAPVTATTSVTIPAASTLATTTGAVGSVTGAVGSVTGLTASNLDATISSRMATYTQPAGFLAATFPTGTVANTTNITAGTITTATNLTTNNDKTGYALSAAGITAIWAEIMEGAVTAVQMMRGFASALMGKASGLDTNAPKYRDLGDTKNRIDATTDSNGNRSAVTTDLT